MHNQIQWQERKREYAQVEKTIGLQMWYPHRKPSTFKAQFRSIKIKETVKSKYNDNLQLCFENFKDQGP